MKLCFIDGTSVKPVVTDAHFKQWIRVDSMVTTWILNSLTTEIVADFMYTKSTRTLWLDLQERYQECNGPLLYQLQHKTEAFSRLLEVWVALDVLMPTPQCTCGGCTYGASKATADQAIFTPLIQFLMGFSDTFGHLRDQLLVMDPIPINNNAYSMILRVENRKKFISNE
ncbi:hypothetical protein Sango_3105000 [Sesamum angolense]|uniref:Uncharacterized protein n=1 Tax=Sesamum angolense TaxID=2727404 RepID=A0AAE1T8I0_9LAMI|nr:hypothetical protein Sango_3105000 [Sesamum angolense]